VHRVGGSLVAGTFLQFVLCRVDLTEKVVSWRHGLQPAIGMPHGDAGVPDVGQDLHRGRRDLGERLVEISRGEGD